MFINRKNNAASIGDAIRPATKAKISAKVLRSPKRIRSPSGFPLAELCVVGSVATLFFSATGAVMVYLNYSLEQKDSFTSLAEHYKIRSDILGFVFLGLAVSIPVFIGIGYGVATCVGGTQTAEGVPDIQRRNAPTKHQSLLLPRGGKPQGTGFSIFDQKCFRHSKDSSAF